MSMEIIILTPAEKFLKAVEFNHAELKSALAEALKKYEGVIYTVNSIRDAKADRATLNKFKDAIEVKRKEIKAKCLAPYLSFEEKVKELTAMVDEQAAAIDKQVKAFEEKDKEEKKNIITERWNAIAGPIAEDIGIARIFNERWLNAGYNINTVFTDMEKILSDIIASLHCIEKQAGDYLTPVKERYLETLSLTAALEYKEKLANLDKAKAKEQAAAQDTTPEDVITPKDSAELKAYDFRVWLTKSQKEALVGFLKLHNIKYGKVK